MPTDAKEITNALGMKLALIPAGEFEMGSTDSDKEAYDDEKPQHRVRITRPFYLGVYEVSQEEYETVMGRNPSWFSAQGRGKDRMAGQDTRRHPVECVSWNDAIAFCNKLSEREGLRPYYRFGVFGGAIGRLRVSTADGGGVGICLSRWGYNPL